MLINNVGETQVNDLTRVGVKTTLLDSSHLHKMTGLNICDSIPDSRLDWSTEIKNRSLFCDNGYPNCFFDKVLTKLRDSPYL